jgi:hypothetical protein
LHILFYFFLAKKVKNIIFLHFFFSIKENIARANHKKMKHERVCVYKPFISYFHPKMPPVPPGE